MFKRLALIGTATLIGCTLMACTAETSPEVTVADLPPEPATAPIGAYMIVHGKGYGPGELGPYAATLPPIYEKYGGHYVAFETDIDVAEGDSDYNSIIVSAWPSKEAARAFWDSPEYAEAMKLREGIGSFDVVIISALPTD
jgi:uncharacterized protein (DUF1330 family)